MREKWLASSVAEKEQIINSISKWKVSVITPMSPLPTPLVTKISFLEAELAALKDQHRFLSGIKQRLDETVRKEKERAAEERRAKVEALIEGINAALKDPKNAGNHP